MSIDEHGPPGPTPQGRTSPVTLFALTADPLLTAREAAAFRRQGLSTFWRDVKEGRVPQPVRITPKAPRWRLSDLCPPREATAPVSPTKARTTRK